MSDLKNNSMFVWTIFILIIASSVAIITFKYINIAKDLHTTHARNLASGLTSATAANYTLKKFNHSKGVAIQKCKDITQLLGNHYLPMGFQIVDQTLTSESITNCSLEGPGIADLKFSEIGIR